MLLIQAILNGVFIGSIYGLIALGLTLVFGVMKIINFAHGSLLTIGMFLTLWITSLIHVNLYFCLIIVGPALFFGGYLIQNYLIKSVLQTEQDVREPISVLLLTSGFWIFSDNLLMVIFGPDYHSVPSPFSRNNWIIADALFINKARFFAFTASVVMCISTHIFLRHSEIGRSIVAVGQDRRMASLLGIDIYKIYNIAFGVATLTVGVAATVLSAFYYVHPNAGIHFGIKAFIIVVLGGLGSVPGAFLGGIIVGSIESVGSQFISATLTEGIIYAVFLGVLFIRPSGLFGVKQDW